jgi:hypothetical protein
LHTDLPIIKIAYGNNKQAVFQLDGYDPDTLTGEQADALQSCYCGTAGNTAAALCSLLLFRADIQADCGNGGVLSYCCYTFA